MAEDQENLPSNNNFVKISRDNFDLMKQDVSSLFDYNLVDIDDNFVNDWSSNYFFVNKLNLNKINNKQKFINGIEILKNDYKNYFLFYWLDKHYSAMYQNLVNQFTFNYFYLDKNILMEDGKTSLRLFLNPVTKRDYLTLDRDLEQPLIFEHDKT